MTQIDELTQRMLEIDEDTLKAQLGIRAQEISQDATARSASLETLDASLMAIPRGSVPGDADVNFGDRLFKRLNAKSYNLLCSDISVLAQDDTLKKLQDAYQESAAKAAGFLAPVLIANLGLAPAVGAIVAALVVKMISSATSETICEVWKEKLEPSEIQRSAS